MSDTTLDALQTRRLDGLRQRPLKPAAFDADRFAELVEEQLQLIGEDASRDGLAKTPDRVAKSFIELTRGYRQDPRAVVNGAMFDVQSDEMVIVCDIDFYSLCEHHLLPFFGKCHIGYLPNERVIGLSKLPRLVEVELITNATTHTSSKT